MEGRKLAVSLLSASMSAGIAIALMAGCSTRVAEHATDNVSAAASSVTMTESGNAAATGSVVSEGNAKSASNATNSAAGNDSTITGASLGSLKSFSAKTMDGGTFTQADLASKDVTVINFWSVYCGPCIEEMPDLSKFAAKLPSNVQLITACLDGSEDVQSVKDILSSAGYTGTTLVSGDGDYSTLNRNIIYTPTTILVDKDGNILGNAIIGSQNDLSATYTAAINDALRSMGKQAIS